MTAAELHALVSPLWAKWPECRTTDTEDGTVGVLDWDADNEWHLRFQRADTGAWFIGQFIGECAAAALIRVAIEDALHRKELSVTLGAIDPNAPDKDKWVELFWPGHADSDEDGRVFFSGPTLLHALVATALAVAKEKP